MKAAVYRGAQRFAVEDIPVPSVGPGEILVRVDACGVCVTDIKKIQKALLSGPRVFGHEIAGTVAAVGAGARYREGDRVVVHHHIPCSQCFFCAQRAYAQCDQYKRNGTTAGFEPSGGGFAEYVLALDWIVDRGTILIPDGVAPAVASFVEPVNTCLKAIKKAGVREGETALVVGQGQIGLILMQLCRWAGATAFTSDPLEDRRAMSRRLGSDEAFDAQNAGAEARSRTGGRGVDIALVAASGGGAMAQAVAATRPGGRIMVFAATSPGETAEIDLGLLCTAEKDILTSYSASVEVQELAAQLVFAREVCVEELITHRFPLQCAPEAVALASQPRPGVLKVVLERDPGRQQR